MTHSQFKSKYLGKSLGNPRTGTYRGQCVSATRRYMEEVLGVRTAIWGHAKDYWTNPEVLKRFDKVRSPKTGDIVVYGANPSNPYGHIGMYDSGKLLSSNYNWPLHLTVASLSYPNRLGYLRKKGATVAKATKAQITAAYKKYLGRKPDAGGLKHYLASGKTISWIIADIKRSAEYAKRQARLKAEKKAEEARQKALEAKRKAEEAKKAEEEARKKNEQSMDKLVQENNQLLKQILALLQSVVDKVFSIFK